MGEVKVSVTHFALVETLGEFGEFFDELASSFVIYRGVFAIKAIWQSSFQRLCTGDLFGDDEASFFKSQFPLATIGDGFWG